MEYLFLIFLCPLFIVGFAKVLHPEEITWKEFALAIGVSMFLSASVYALGSYSSTSDVLVLNGKVISKERREVSCDHSYDCHCYTTTHTDSQGRTYTTEHCSTCYEHNYDVDWLIHSTVGSVKIDRVNRRGTDTPPRWSSVTTQEPFSRTQTYTNYIKAAPDSLFHGRDMEKFEKSLPAYPANIFDYYKINRVIPVGVQLPDLALWNQSLSYRLRELGPKKQVNVVGVIVKTGDSKYANALEAKWLGGKKNDVVVILGTPNPPKISWVRVLSWTDRQILKIKLRDELMSLGKIDREPILDVITSNVEEYFVRKPMKDFEYLKDDVEPPLWCVVLALILGAVSSLFLSYKSIKEDLL